MTDSLPSGTVTFLFTDVEGSTRLWEDQPEAMTTALARHDELLRDAINAHGGHVVKTTGDGFFAAFATASDAMSGALDGQAKLAAEAWADKCPIRVRMGLHTGASDLHDGDYHGPTVNRAARVMGVAHGGQILCTRVTLDVSGGAAESRSLGQHRLRDLSAPQELFQVGDGEFPPPRSLDLVPTNLPTVMTDLIGRSDDVKRLAGLVSTERLVTLTGVGGVGKTRLAIAVAAAATGSFPDGVWLVELAPADSADGVVLATAAAINARATDLESLARLIANRRALIVLDNCEHVLDATANLAEAILHAGPEPAILATSREPLAIDGETVRGVRSLPVPDRDASDTEIAASPAVRLFVDRASAATDSFTPTESNLADIAGICSRLDGIPLAIELAAARVRAMPPDEIARRLDERFRLLSAGRGTQERHRTLQATVAWSHDLLTAEQQVVFRRLAAFPASFDLDAAEAIAGDPELDVIDDLVRLVDQSLVEYDPSTGRYRLLETLRQYGADRLAEAGEIDLVRDRHLAFYESLLDGAGGRDDYPTVAVLRRVMDEVENLQAAVDWLAAHDRWTQVLDFARRSFMCMTFIPTTTYRWYRDALGHDVDLSPHDRIDAYGEIAQLAVSVGESGERWAQRSIDLADETGLSQSPWAWSALAIANYLDDDPRGPLLAAERTLAIATERHNETATLVALTRLACATAAYGDVERSETLVADVLERAHRFGEVAMFTPVIGAAGSYLTSRFEPDFERGLRVLEANPLDIGDLGLGWSDRMWGLAHLGLGHQQLAVRYLTRSLRDTESMPGMLKEAALALSVALYDAGEPTLGATLEGYSDSHFPDATLRDMSSVWLGERKATAEATLDSDGLTKAREAGAQLPRRGYLHLLAEIDQLAARSPTA